jgi:hypothetical protein
LRAYRALPKNKALIKFLSEEGIKQLLQKTENQYMQDNNRDMHIIDEALYFVIEEKNNQVELLITESNSYLPIQTAISLFFQILELKLPELKS